MKQKTPYKVFLNPSFQFKFIVYYSAAVLLFLAFFYLAKRYYFNLLFEEGISLGLAHTHIYFKLLLRQEDLLQRIFLFTSLITLSFLFVFGLLLSKRIAGPLFKLNVYFQKLSAGEDTGEMQFRKKDFFKELPPNYNAFRKLVLKNQKEGKEIIHPKDAA